MKNIVIWILSIICIISIGLNIYLYPNWKNVSSQTKNQTNSIAGIITSISKDKITVNTTSGDMVFKVNKNTKYFKDASDVNMPKNTAINFGDLKTNYSIGIEYIISGRNNIATTIMILGENILSGTILSVANNEIKILSAIDNKEYTIRVEANTEISKSELPKVPTAGETPIVTTTTPTGLPTSVKIALNDIVINDPVTINLKSDVNGANNLTASAIVVFK